MGTVTKIIDGDTLDTGNIRIRLSLTNTPETDEAGYQNAKDFTSSLCPVGSKVLIDQDDVQLTDVYGRMLAKVTCGDKVLNSELLYEGHANIMTEYCDESQYSGETWAQDHGCSMDDVPTSNLTPIAEAGGTQTVNEGTSVILDGGESADQDGSQLSYSWKQVSGPSVVLNNLNSPTPTFIAPSVNEQTMLVFSLTVSDGELTDTDEVSVSVKDVPSGSPTPPSQVDEENCDPSYPTVCIPPPPPDLDCGEISFRDFTVLQPDLHNFDNDNDGVGCES